MLDMEAVGRERVRMQKRVLNTKTGYERTERHVRVRKKTDITGY